MLGVMFDARPNRANWRAVVYATPSSSLQQAVDALPAAGGIVRLPCGVYGPVVISKSNVSLDGSGNCSSITASPFSGAAIVTVTGGAARTVIGNLQILGQAVDQTSMQRCLYLTGGSTGATVRQVKFGGTTSSNGCNIQIHVDPTSSRNVISSNTLTQAIGTGNGGGYGILIEGSGFNVVSGNKSVQTATEGRHHIYLSAGASSNQVIANRLTGGTSDQIVVFAYDSEPAARSNIVQNNILTGMQDGLGARAAIHIAQNADSNHIIGNQILEPALAGIEVEGSALKGESHADHNDLESNQVYFAGQFGILILGSSNTTIKGNTVYEASQSASGAYPGIEVSSNSAYAVARNNQVLNDTSYGFTMQRCGLQVDSGAPRPSGTVVNGNQFGVGVIGMAFKNGGTGTVIESNILNYKNSNPPKR